MIKHFYILALSVLISNIAIAQQRRNGHLPVARTKAEYQLMIDNAKNRINTLGKAVVFPENMRMPGEFEESRAVVISWAYEYDADFTQILGIDYQWPKTGRLDLSPELSFGLDLAFYFGEDSVNLGRIGNKSAL
jgi:hypothetical protein